MSTTTIEKPTYNYLEIVERTSNKIVKRVNLTAHGMVAQQRISDGIKRNTNEQKFEVKTYRSNLKLPKIN